MTTSKRMALAFGCMLLALAVFGLIYAIPNAIRYGSTEQLPILFGLLMYLAVALPGWVLALPFVLLFRHADGWRTWAILVIGTAIGPVFMLMWTLLITGSLRSHGDGVGVGVAMSVYIGFPTTLFYVLFLRFFTTRARSRDVKSRNLAAQCPTSRF